MNNWLMILLLGLILFFNRYLFLEPKTPVKLPRFIKEMLNYSAPAILTAICVPIVLLNADKVRELYNPYLLGALACILFALRIRSMLLSVLAGISVFYSLVYWLF